MNTPHPSDPGSFPRRALVCLAGMSPQVVTETLFALATQAKPFFVTELHIVTTRLGARAVQERLLDSGVLDQLARDLPGQPLPPLSGRTQLHVVQRAGMPLDDIDSIEDNTAVADLVLRVLRPLTADATCAVHASIAGGRKSMGFYLGYVLSLLARPQDALSHILVNAPFESDPDFYYPPPAPRMLSDRDGTQRSTADARLLLAPVAFVRMADGFDVRWQSDDLNFESLVNRAQQALVATQVEVAPASRQVRFAGAHVTLEPALMAWYVFFAMRRQRALQEDARLKAPGLVLIHRLATRSIGMSQALLDVACGRVGVEKQSAQIGPAELRTRVSPINQALKRGFGSALSARLLIAGPADRGTRDGQYGLIGLDPAHVHIV